MNRQDIKNKKKIVSSINRKIGRAIAHCQMINERDRIIVAVSGGKDSLTLLHFLKIFQKKAPIRFDLLAVHVDQGGPFSIGAQRVQSILEKSGIEYHIEKQNIINSIQEISQPGDTPCSVCGRLRRGVLYRIASEREYNKIALGHHSDDLLETFLLNSFFSGKIGTMSPHYLSGANNIHVIRPLYMIKEAEIVSFVKMMEWESVTCSFCEAQSGFKRKDMKDLLNNLESQYPGLKESMFHSLSNIHLQEMPDIRFWKDEFSLPNNPNS